MKITMEGIYNHPIPAIVEKNPNISDEKIAQEAIRKGDMATIKSALERIHINLPLPNRELPLHFAVKEGQVDAVNSILEVGGDPTQKDYQNLSAIDHAVLLSNEQILVPLLGQQMKIEFEAVNKEFCSESAAKSLGQVSKIFQEIFSGKAKYGLSPLQRAVLHGDKEAVKSLLSSVNVREKIFPLGLSLLHLAAMGKSPEVIEILVKYGANLEEQDVAGRTPLHFAAVNSDGKSFGALVRAGADIWAKDQNGTSAVAVMGAAVHDRDPLNLSKAQVAMFIAGLASWVLTLGIDTGFIKIDEESSLGSVVALLTTAIRAGFILNWSEFFVMIGNLDKTWKKVLAWISMLTINGLPFVGSLFQAWSTYHIARVAFRSLKTCYNNVRYRTWKSVRNVILCTTNAAISANNLWSRLSLDYEI